MVVFGLYVSTKTVTDAQADVLPRNVLSVARARGVAKPFSPATTLNVYVQWTSVVSLTGNSLGSPSTPAGWMSITGPNGPPRRHVGGNAASSVAPLGITTCVSGTSRTPLAAS